MLTEHEIAPAADDAQALIEEARRRQRARRRRIALAVCAAVLAGGIGYVANGSGGASNASAPLARSGAAPSAPPKVQWKELANDGLPPGSIVTSVTTYDGHLVAAGQYFSGDGDGNNTAPGYPVAASPIVWTSTDGTSWTLAWQAGTIALGSGAVPTLVATPEGLFLFDSGTGGSALWRSNDGTAFVRQALPEGMAGRVVNRGVFGHGRLVVTEWSNGAGGPAYAGAGVIWISLNGTSWRRAVDPKNASVGEVAVTASGFLLAGESASTRPTVWTSRNGVTWRARTLGRRGSVSVAAHGNEMVTAQSWKFTPLVLWWSIGGKKWDHSSAAAISTYAYTSGPFAVPGGFALVDHAPAGPHVSIWYSAGGAHWSKLQAVGTAPNRRTTMRFFPDSAGLLGVSGATGKGKVVSFWQATIVNPG